jgi:hypothetical protein
MIPLGRLPRIGPASATGTGGKVRRRMPLRQEAQFLRERARRLREIAGAYRTALSNQLREMADELDARADELERAKPSAD